MVTSSVKNGIRGCAMPQIVIDEINRGGLPYIQIDILNLGTDEFCCYVDDMKNIFNKSVRKEMETVHTDGTIDMLDMEVEEQAKLYFHK
jgi:hypothetical protein